MSINDFAINVGNGMKKISRVVFIYLAVQAVFVCYYYFPWPLTLVSKFLGEKFNVFSMLFATLVNGSLAVDFEYASYMISSIFAINYSEYLLSRLNRIIANNVEFEGYSFEIADEQMFADLKTPDPHKFYIVIKYLSAQKVYNTTTQPVQIQVVSEADGFSKCKLLLDTFVNAYNWQMEKDGSTYIKQQYNTPVVLSNFQSIGYGMRSVLYIAGTIFVMEEVFENKEQIEISKYYEKQPKPDLVAISEFEAGEISYRKAHEED